METLPAVPKTLLDMQISRDEAIATYQQVVNMIAESKKRLGEYIYPHSYEIRNWKEDFTKELNT